MKRFIPLLIVALAFGASAFAQNEIDALRYSQRLYGGTARFTSMAGAFGALGGDFSVLSTNPAGIGIFRRSEFTFTPSFYNQKTTSNYGGNQLDDYKYNVNFSNAGIVLAYYEPQTTNAWKGVMFGFGYNRLNNFHNRMSLTGANTSSSLLDIYIADAQGVGGDTSAMNAFGTQLALNSGAIFLDTSNGLFYHHLEGSSTVIQSKSVTSSGAMGETVFTLGGNYSDKLYLGATLGIPHIRYHQESTYSESGDSAAWNGFQSFELHEDLRTTGVGVNFKFGMIYKPTDWVRIGGAVHSPSYFEMHDDWSSSMKTKFSNANWNATSKSPNGLYDYSLVTPMRTIVSLGFVVKKMGLIGFDYEFVDYPSASLRSDNYTYIEENNAIRQKYIEGSNIRIGTEWRLTPVSLRAGAAYYSSPYKASLVRSGSRMDYSAGIGFREENFFLDFAFVLSRTSENYYIYDATLVEPSSNKSTSSNIMMTMGFKF